MATNKKYYFSLEDKAFIESYCRTHSGIKIAERIGVPKERVRKYCYKNKLPYNETSELELPDPPAPHPKPDHSNKDFTKLYTDETN